MTIEDVLADGDDLAYRYIATGTHEGELMGIDPTGKRVDNTTTIARFGNDEAIEIWMHADRLGLMRQLGVIPSPDELSEATVEGEA